MKALPRRATIVVPPVAPSLRFAGGVSPPRHNSGHSEGPHQLQVARAKPAPDHWRTCALAWTDAQGTRAAAPGAATTDSWVKSG
jgi:hypothetical protein